MNGTIGIVTTSFPEVGDGSEAAGSFVSDLAHALAERGPVRVVAPGREERVDALAPALQVFRFRAPPRLSTLRLRSPVDAWRIACVLRDGRRATRRMLADRAVRHCWALWALPSGWWARDACRAAGIGYSVWTLGSDIWSLGRVPLVRNVLAGVLRDADRVCADGLVLADDTARIARRDVAFLPSSRDLPARAKALRAAPPYRLLFLGRWHPNKGVDLLLDALDRLEDAEWQRIERVTILGGGPLSELVHARCAALTARGRPLVVGGFVDKEAAADAFADADFLVIPSRIDSIPVVFSDAASSRTPMLATPVGDLPRLFAEHRVGVVADAPDGAAIARALAALVRTAPCAYADGLAAAAARFSLRERVVPLLAGDEA